MKKGMSGDEERTRLEEKKAASTIQLLFKAARLLNEHAIGRIQERTKRPVRAAHTSLLPHIDLEGTRLTVIAKRLGVTKQAAGQLVDELVALGMLERIPDPADARAKLIRFSKRGKQGLFEGLDLLRELEGQLRSQMGESKMVVFHEVLVHIVGTYAP